MRTWSLLLFASLALGCGDDETVFGPSGGAGGSEPTCTDDDGDGVCAEDGDCCDLDDAVPGGFSALPTACGGWNHNCDVLPAEHEIDQLATACDKGTLGSCDQITEVGWRHTIPSCGEAGEWVTGCLDAGFNGGCDPVTEMRTQRCR